MKFPIRMKLQMYLSSLSLLFLMITILNIFTTKGKLITYISMIMFIISLVGIFNFTSILKSSFKENIDIKKLKNKSYEHLTFLATYVIPLTSLDLTSTRYFIILCIFLVVIGIIYIKTDLYCANPILAVLGYRLYEGDIELREKKLYKDCTIIAKSEITETSEIIYIQLDKKTFYVKEKTDGNNR